VGAPRLTSARKSAYPAAVLRRAVLLAALLAPTAARAAPIELVEQRKNFMIFDDVDGSIEHANWYSRDSFYTGFRAVEAGFLANHPDDSDFLVVYSTFSWSRASARSTRRSPTTSPASATATPPTSTPSSPPSSSTTPRTASSTASCT
jgi:hypothetical protein